MHRQDNKSAGKPATPSQPPDSSNNNSNPPQEEKNESKEKEPLRNVLASKLQGDWVQYLLNLPPSVLVKTYMADGYSYSEGEILECLRWVLNEYVVAARKEYLDINFCTPTPLCERFLFFQNFSNEIFYEVGVRFCRHCCFNNKLIINAMIHQMTNPCAK